MAGTLAPTAVVVSLALAAVLLRTSSTDQAPPPRSRTLAVTPPVKPALPVIAVSMSFCSSVWNEAAVA